MFIHILSDLLLVSSWRILWHSVVVQAAAASVGVKLPLAWLQSSEQHVRALGRAKWEKQKTGMPVNATYEPAAGVLFFAACFYRISSQ